MSRLPREVSLTAGFVSLAVAAVYATQANAGWMLAMMLFAAINFAVASRYD